MQTAETLPAVPELVELTTQEAIENQARTLDHPPPAFFQHFQKERIQVYSFRRAGKVLLTLTSNEKGICAHIFGAKSRPPTQEELHIATEMLLDFGIMVQYDRNRVC